MTIMKGLRGLLACLLRAEATRYFTITIKHQPWLGLAGPGHTRTEELRVVTIPVLVVAGSKDDRDKQTDPGAGGQRQGGCQ